MPETTKKMQLRIRTLEARVKELEAILKCRACGHLRNEHDEDEGGPCYGGREGLAPGEGEYCGCFGFESEAPAHVR